MLQVYISGYSLIFVNLGRSCNLHSTIQCIVAEEFVVMDTGAPAGKIVNVSSLHSLTFIYYTPMSI